MKTHLPFVTLVSCLASLLQVPLGRAAIVTLPAAADTFINGALPANNAGSVSWFDAGTDGVSGTRRGLIRFNLASVPAGSTVNSAVLRLTVTKVPSLSPANSNFEIYRLQANWTEGEQIGNNGAAAAAGEANWTARMNGTANWTAPGAASDAAATASASAAVGSSFFTAYSWTSAAVVSDVQF